MKLTVRKANVSDLPVIHALMDDFRAARKLSSKNKLFHKRTVRAKKLTAQDLRKEIFLLGFHSGTPAGFIRGQLLRRKGFLLSRAGYIKFLFIRNDFRRQGYAQNLMRALIKIFKKKHCDIVTLKTDFENDAAQKLYSRFGMHETSIEFWKKI